MVEYGFHRIPASLGCPMQGLLLYRYLLRDRCSRAKQSNTKPDGALLVAATIAAAIRLRGEPVQPSPRLTTTIRDAVSLARLVVAEIHK